MSYLLKVLLAVKRYTGIVEELHDLISPDFLSRNQVNRSYERIVSIRPESLLHVKEMAIAEIESVSLNSITIDRHGGRLDG